MSYSDESSGPEPDPEPVPTAGWQASSRAVLREAMAGVRPTTPRHHNRIGAALNDHFVEFGRNHPVPSADRVPAPHPDGGGP